MSLACCAPSGNGGTAPRAPTKCERRGAPAAVRLVADRDTITDRQSDVAHVSVRDRRFRRHGRPDRRRPGARHGDRWRLLALDNADLQDQSWLSHRRAARVQRPRLGHRARRRNRASCASDRERRRSPVGHASLQVVPGRASQGPSRRDERRTCAPRSDDIAHHLLPRALCSVGPHSVAAKRAVYLDKDGVVRWRDDRQEVTLFGANYVLPTASDYRAAGYLHADRKKMIDEDMAQFARMGWDGLRLTFWGDWEASDSAGNLIANDHLDLQDYLIARARERGIYMLFSPIQLYGSNWPDALGDTTAPGFGRHFGKERMGTDPAAHRRAGELPAPDPRAREPLHRRRAQGRAGHPLHRAGQRAGAPPGGSRRARSATSTRSPTRCAAPAAASSSSTTSARISASARRSGARKAQGVTFGWYPTGLNSGHELQGNYLRGVDDFPDMLRPELARLPRIVYEFDSPDLRTGTMYPAMARTFRAVGTQFAAMFAYDMLRTASRNLGWQTHYLNLVYTPRKAMSAIIAAEAMHRLPGCGPTARIRGTPGSATSTSPTTENLGELVARDAFLYAGSTRSTPPDPAALRRIAGLWLLPHRDLRRARGSTSSTRCARVCGGSRSIPTRCRSAIRSSRPARTRS